MDNMPHDETQSNSGGPGETNKAQDWIDAGFSGHLITLEPGEKRTLQHGWLANIETDLDLVLGWDNGRGLGLKTARFPAFDIEDGPHAAAILSIVLSHVGADAPVRSRPGSASRGVLVKLRDGETWAPHSVKTAAGDLVLEVSGYNKQFHVEGFRSDKGVWLEWTKQPTVDGLLEVDAAWLSGVIQQVRDYLDSRGLGANVNAGGAGRLTGTDKDVTAPLDEVTWIVKHIPNDERFDDREAWIRMGHAIKGAAGDEGRDLWLDWCAQREQVEDCGRVWDTIHRPTTIGRGQLYKWALEKFPRVETDWDFRHDFTDDDPLKTNLRTQKDRWLATAVIIAACSEDSGRAGLANAVGQKAKRFADFAAAAASFTKPKPIVDGFAWPNIVHGVIAAPGVGKSLWTLHSVVAAIHNALPHDAAQQPKDAPHVIALFGEDSDEIIWERAAAVRDHHAKRTAHPDRIFEIVANRPLELFKLDAKGENIQKRRTPGLHHVCDILEEIAELPDDAPVVLLFDMLRHTFFGNENDRGQIDAVFRVWKAIMNEFRARTGRAIGIVFTHHMNKASSRAGGVDAFAAAGSIGIEGNSRVITQMRPVGGTGEFVELRLSKTNYGVTGTKQYYRKKPVPSVYPGEDTIVLEPVSEREALSGDAAVHAHRTMQAVKGLHAWNTTGAGAGQFVSYGKRDAKGTVSILEALADAGLHGYDKADIDDIKAAAVRSGAFKDVRANRADVVCRTLLEPVAGWTPAATEAGDDFDVSDREE